MLAATRNRGFLQNEFIIVDPLARKVVHRWPPASGIGGQFADGGKAVCNGGEVEETGRAPVTCWDVDTGEKIGEGPTINGGAPMATAAHSSRIVASDYQRVEDPLSSYEYAKLLKRQVVWDFMGSRELASWRPELQSYINIKHVREEEPFKFAISPNGRYVADGGNGIIRLFKIEP